LAERVITDPTTQAAVDRTHELCAQCRETVERGRECIAEARAAIDRVKGLHAAQRALLFRPYELVSRR
jgi:hypothetical protein